MLRLAARSRVKVLRSVKKTASYEVVHTLVTAVMAWGLLVIAGIPMYSGVGFAAVFAIVDITVDTVVFYAHERVWAHIEED